MSLSLAPLAVERPSAFQVLIWPAVCDDIRQAAAGQASGAHLRNEGDALTVCVRRNRSSVNGHLADGCLKRLQ